MSDIVIQAENLGKKYMIGHQAEKGHYVALRDVVAQNARGFWRKTKDVISGKPIIQGDALEEVWALKEISLAIHRGEAVGVIGRNGAGKSTLLKILSRITEPTSGRVTIRGRVASLLEVGTGFHPELTGRENIYLNGAILGMKRAEIARKFDEIVDFSGVEQYIDTPVKRYSSGMYVRLAFAVAAHLEPEILLVDEVLAVGDAEFQRKCLGKMGDVARGGRTVLFISHNMAAIQQLCERAVLLSSGRVDLDDLASSVVRRYLAEPFSQTNVTSVDCRNLHHLGNGEALILSARLKDASGAERAQFVMGETLVVEFEVETPHRNLRLTHAVEIIDASGIPILHLWDWDNGQTGLAGRQRRVAARMPNLTLYPGRYLVTLWVGLPRLRADRVENCLGFEVVPPVAATRDFPRNRGVVSSTAEWHYTTDGARPDSRQPDTIPLAPYTESGVRSRDKSERPH